MSSLSPYTIQVGTPESAKRGAANHGGRGTRDTDGSAGREEVGLVLLQLGDQCIAAGRRQAAFHCRADDLQHQRVGQVTESPAEAIERAREPGLVPAREAG